MEGSNPSAGRRIWLVRVVAALNLLGAGAGAFGLATGWLALSRTAQARLPWGSIDFAGVGLLLVWLGVREVQARPVPPPT